MILLTIKRLTSQQGFIVMSEQQLQNKIIKYLEGIGCYVIKTIQVNKRGCPDLLFCKDGTFNAIEVKAPGKLRNVSEIQQFHLDLINKTGGTAIAADSLETVKDKFK